MFKVIPFEPKTLSWWHSQAKNIDFEPTYQRKGRLWSRTDKAFLIDSILNEYDIPKVYIADFSFVKSPLNKKNLQFAIVDGKQRFEAVFDFKEGRLTLEPDFELRSNSKLKLGGLGYADLAKSYPEVAASFDNFGFTVMRVITDEEGSINELFVRLNRSKPLTGAEIRNAMLGAVSDTARILTRHEFFTEYIAFSVKRALDLNAATKLLWFEYNEKLAATKKKNLDGFARLARGEKRKVKAAGSKVVDTLDRMTEIFLPRDKLLKSAGVVPIYYWLVREVPVEADAYLREFLVEFEAQRKVNREKLGRKTDSELAKYDRLNRSPDDPVSLKVRFEILQKRLNRFNLAGSSAVPASTVRHGATA
jgi:Protein of unknown function DUF262